MKGKMTGPVLTVLVVVAFALFFAWSIRAYTVPPERTSYSVSVIVYGSGENADRWKFFDQGIGQACSELDIERPVPTIVRLDDPDRQRAVVRRALDDGADAMIVAVGDASELSPEIERVAESIPVVLAESGASGRTCIAADNAAMGRALADCVAEAEGPVGVLVEGLERLSVAERYEGFRQRMEELDIAVSELRRVDGDGDLKTYVAASLASASLNAVAILDNETLEAVVDAAPASMVQVSIYGVGSSSKVVHALDRGVVAALVFPNEFAIGYAAMMELAGELGLVRETEPVEILYHVVDHESLYEPENERLLFPITQ